ncbi:MAG TPA: fibronectin type III domain-containing protein, partial [Thermoplasmata archaeon]|nr:fibronectin type III domain-containing protein [Thermoplasmata archaeon]
MSGPGAAGATGLINAYFKQGFYPLGAATPANAYDPTGAAMKAVAMSSTDDMTGPGAMPNGDEGWGRIDLINALKFTADNRMFRLVDNRAGLATGNELQYTFDIATAQKLRVVLVWSDWPGALGATKQLVNDLDLEVKAPSGSSYLGNVWSGGQSNTGGSPDVLNTEELVQLNTPAAGAYTITVRGSNAPKGPQPFALVVNADINPKAGLVVMDKAVYGDADTIKISLTDGSFATGGQSTTVKVTSGTEPLGETITLNGGFGLLSSTLATTFAAPAADGKISVAHGDTVTVTYADTDPTGSSIAQAKIDATYPAIFDVTVKFINDRGASIFWNTSKPATSTVYYGTTPSLGQTKTDTNLTVVHQVDLGGLAANTLYYFDVEGTDPQNHKVRDANGGVHYTFTTTPVNDILVVDGSDNTIPFMDQTLGDLGRHGWGTTTWYKWREADPPLTLLQAYKAVVWDTVERYPPLDDSTMAILKEYNDKGGRLMMGGHDLAWAFGDPGQNCYGTTTGCTFLKFQLKASWVTDPPTWSGQRGIASDPISDPWATRTIPYVPIRSGGAGDQIAVVPAGGTTSVIWKNDLNNDIAVKWLSSGNNGTAGQGTWGGTPSKVIFNTFEAFRLNPTSPNDVDRSAVFNSSIVWLLGRYHPLTTITEPAAGGSYSGTVTVKWTATAFGGLTIGKQDLFYSPDGGRSWTLIASPAPGTLQHSWDTSLLPNGNEYCLRMIVADSGTPALTGNHVHCKFAVNNPGGDKSGPLVAPGSIVTVPNPANEG